MTKYDDELVIICLCGCSFMAANFEVGEDVHCPECNAGPLELPAMRDADRCAEMDGGYQCELHRGHARHHIYFKPEGVVLDARHLAEPHDLFKLSILRGK
jgi:hypothetical protein